MHTTPNATYFYRYHKKKWFICFNYDTLFDLFLAFYDTTKTSKIFKRQKKRLRIFGSYESKVKKESCTTNVLHRKRVESE